MAKWVVLKFIMLNKFSLFFRRIFFLLFLFIEISLGIILFFATQNQIWILALMAITLVLFFAITWVFKALE